MLTSQMTSSGDDRVTRKKETKRWPVQDAKARTNVIILSAALALPGVAQTPQTYNTTVDIYDIPGALCVYSRFQEQATFRDTSGFRWRSLSVRIPLSVLKDDALLAPAPVTLELNGQQIGDAVYVSNVQTAVCGPYAVYEFSTTALRPESYNPNGINTLKVVTPILSIGGQPADLTFSDPISIDLTLTGQILDGSAMESKHLGTATTSYAQVPLGLELSLGLQNAGKPVDATYTLIPVTPANLDADALYKTGVALEYDRNVRSAAKVFRGVHLGTQSLIIVPADSKIPPVTVTFGVFEPGLLGDDNAYDDGITMWGNRRGIPPHILKGLIRQEGPFNPNEYRYEPISATSGDRYIQTVLANPRFVFGDYRLETDTGLGKGSLLLDLNSGTAYTTVDDVQPRSTFHLPRGPKNAQIGIRPLDICPTNCVSAAEIMLNNEAKWRWNDPSFVGSTDWLDAAHLQMLDFTAQTPTAASYGLMQTMYVKAAELHWSTFNGMKNPSLLFDSPQNLAAGGGSLSVGTLEFYKAYRNCRTGDWATDPNFKDSDEYHGIIVDALNWYNHGNSNKNPNYGANAWAYSQQFSPSHPLSKIFP
jgi:hypothetical protein